LQGVDINPPISRQERGERGGYWGRSRGRVSVPAVRKDILKKGGKDKKSMYNSGVDCIYSFGSCVKRSGYRGVRNNEIVNKERKRRKRPYRGCTETVTRKVQSREKKTRMGGVWFRLPDITEERELEQEISQQTTQLAITRDVG